MAMTNWSYKQRIERIEELEVEIKYIRKQLHLCYEYINHGIMVDEQGNDLRQMVTMYNRLLRTRDRQLQHHKEMLNNRFNLEALGYDCPMLLDESWYENQFKTNGYFIGIRL